MSPRPTHWQIPTFLPSFAFHEWQCRLGMIRSPLSFRILSASFGGTIRIAPLPPFAFRILLHSVPFASIICSYSSSSSSSRSFSLDLLALRRLLD